MYLQGLNIDPDCVEAHQALRDISLKRKASGGKNLGMMERMKLRNTKDDKQSMLNAERLLAFDPGNKSNMLALCESAHKAGFYDTVLWIGDHLLKANDDSKSPEKKYYMALKDIYSDIKQWRLAVEACQRAMRADPQDMDLQSELKNLSASATMFDSGYAAGGDFRTTMANKEFQENLLQQDRDVVSQDALVRAITEAEAEFKKDPNDLARLSRLVEALLRTEDMEQENRAIELLEACYHKSNLFSHRQRVGRIKMKQMARMERSLRAEIEKNPKDERLRRDWEQFRNERLEFELREYTSALEHYPTDLQLKYEVAERLFALGKFDEAIPLYQQARADPKLKIDGSIGLGRAFLEAGFVDEAAETLQGVIDEYQLKGDDRALLMYYWQGRAYEMKPNVELALKRYSQVAQWEFTYQDVQQRIKKLRSSAPPR